MTSITTTLCKRCHSTMVNFLCDKCHPHPNGAVSGTSSGTERQPHRHAKLIKAWADGAIIQCLQQNGKWLDVTPNWQNGNEYRIKPEPKPDIVLYGEAVISNFGGNSADKFGEVKSVGNVKWSKDNVQFTFDGETRKLKSVEIIK